MENVAVLIPNYNGGRFIRLTVDAFSDALPGMSIVVVDDASTDDSVTQLMKSPAVLIARDRNGGFAAAVNTGLRHLMLSKFKYVIISNSDVSITKEISSSVLDLIESRFSEPSIAVLGFLEEANTRHLTGADISGFFFVLNLDVLSVVGFFDESFQMYGEEQDFFRRVEEAGFTVQQTGIRIPHRGEGSRVSRMRNSWLSVRNSIWLEVKRRSWGRACRKVVVLFLLINRLYRPEGGPDPSLDRLLRPGLIVGNCLLVAAVFWNIAKINFYRNDEK